MRHFLKFKTSLFWPVAPSNHLLTAFRPIISLLRPRQDFRVRKPIRVDHDGQTEFSRGHKGGEDWLTMVPRATWRGLRPNRSQENRPNGSRGMLCSKSLVFDQKFHKKQSFLQNRGRQGQTKVSRSTWRGWRPNPSKKPDQLAEEVCSFRSHSCSSKISSIHPSFFHRTEEEEQINAKGLQTISRDPLDFWRNGPGHGSGHQVLKCEIYLSFINEVPHSCHSCKWGLN